MNKTINKLAVFGFGISGKSAARLAIAKKIDTFIINQGEVSSWLKEEDHQFFNPAYCFSEKDALKIIDRVDTIILSPGIPRDHSLLKAAHEKLIPIISEIEFAFHFLDRSIPIWAITGSNGKTTTTTMLETYLKLFGKKVFCGGNIGIPLSDLVMSSEYVEHIVLELSSFQLESIADFKPTIASVINLVSHHTERYKKIEDYRAAKLNVFKNMDDPSMMIIQDKALGDQLESYNSKNTSIMTDLQLTHFINEFTWGTSKLKGLHNKANYFVVYLMLKKMNLLNTSLFQNLINSFQGVPHRLEWVRKYQQMDFYNDSKSTNLLATQTALEAFSTQDTILILGGKIRSLEDRFLPGLKKYKTQIRFICLFGEAVDKLNLELKNDFSTKIFKTLSEAVNFLSESESESENSCVVLFSPAHPSYDQYENYMQRGEEFKSLVNNL